MMLLLLRPVLFLSSLLALTAASGYNHITQAACEAKTETILVTRTSVVVDQNQVTQYKDQFNHHTVDVTSIIFLSTTVTQSVQFTQYQPPVVVTRTSFVTSTVYQTEFKTSVATAVATQTSRLLATSVHVQDLTITQTAIVAESVTQTLTVPSIETTVKTVTVTDNVTAFVTRTALEPFFVTETTYNTFYQFTTQTVTSTSTNTHQATVTITDRQYVTKCYEPRVTYGH